MPIQSFNTLCAPEAMAFLHDLKSVTTSRLRCVLWCDYSIAVYGRKLLCCLQTEAAQFLSSVSRRRFCEVFGESAEFY